jgi:hypothetical protein
MHGTLISMLFAASSFVLGCGATFPVPTQQLADTESAERSAAELGAANEPTARLHLQLAHDQLEQAKTAIRDGTNDRAAGLLRRAKADAELAIAITREQAAKTGAAKAADESKAQGVTNASQGGQ